MRFVRKLASVAGAAAGGAFAGSGVGVVAGYTVVPLAAHHFAENAHLRISDRAVLIMASVGSGVAIGAGVGAIVRLRRLRAEGLASVAEPGAAPDPAA